MNIVHLSRIFAVGNYILLMQDTFNVYTDIYIYVANVYILVEQILTAVS